MMPSHQCVTLPVQLMVSPEAQDRGFPAGSDRAAGRLHFHSRRKVVGSGAVFVLLEK